MFVKYTASPPLPGRTLADYVHAKNIEQAAKLLRSTDLLVREIAHKCHYRSLRQFRNAFWQVFGELPVSYRANQRRKMVRERR
jgi:transcriptional regulator GlxA family with amidase domain